MGKQLDIAIQDLLERKREWITEAVEDGTPIPLPQGYECGQEGKADSEEKAIAKETYEKLEKWAEEFLEEDWPLPTMQEKFLKLARQPGFENWLEDMLKAKDDWEKRWNCKESGFLPPNFKEVIKQCSPEEFDEYMMYLLWDL